MDAIFQSCHMRHLNTNRHRPLSSLLRHSHAEKKKGHHRKGDCTWRECDIRRLCHNWQPAFEKHCVSVLGISCQFLASFLGMPLISWMTLGVFLNFPALLEEIGHNACCGPSQGFGEVVRGSDTVQVLVTSPHSAPQRLFVSRICSVIVCFCVCCCNFSGAIHVSRAASF